jgi:hypothetical protein
MNELSVEARAAFEQQMAGDPELRREVAVTRLIESVFRHKGERAVYDALKAMPEAVFNKQYAPRRRFAARFTPTIRMYAAAAAVAIVLLLFGIGTRPLYSSGELFDTAFVADDFEITPSRGEVTAEERYYEAQLSCALTRLASDEPSAPLIRMLSALSATSDFAYREEAAWGLALACLKDNRRSKAEKILSEIIADEGAFAGKAEELLAKLNRKRWF